jgi:hypothetical protein
MMNMDRSETRSPKKNRRDSSYMAGIVAEATGVLFLMAIGYAISALGFLF